MDSKIKMFDQRTSKSQKHGRL